MYSLGSVMFVVSLKELLFIFQQGPMLNTKSCIVVPYGTKNRTLCSEPHHSDWVYSV
jgi:hypothetical protein